MEELTDLIQNIFTNNSLINAVISFKSKTSTSNYIKVKLRPILLNKQISYQFANHTEKQVYHSNLSPIDSVTTCTHLLNNDYKQAEFFTSEGDYFIKISKKGKVFIKRKSPSKTKEDLSHNRTKKYLFEEGTPIPFLIELGVMNAEGKIINKKYDKFRQINRFIEMIADTVTYLPTNKKLTIIDFGCGKSYLTFALYHYLKVIKGYELTIIGLDLKEDVISHCNNLASKFGYDDLKFLIGDIANYEGVNEVDMVVTLHACNTATDAALAKAVKWNASVILSVPCCQHELNEQISNDILAPIFEYGIIKERIAALTTDALRAHMLKMEGYKTQILEFIDMSHTPKNLLIRAVKQDSPIDKEKLIKEYEDIKHFLNVDPSLEKFISEKKKN